MVSPAGRPGIRFSTSGGISRTNRQIETIPSSRPNPPSQSRITDRGGLVPSSNPCRAEVVARAAQVGMRVLRQDEPALAARDSLNTINRCNWIHYKEEFEKKYGPVPRMYIASRDVEGAEIAYMQNYLSQRNIAGGPLSYQAHQMRMSGLPNLGRALGSHEPNMSTEHGEARSHPSGGYVTNDGHHHGRGGDSLVRGSDRGGSSFNPAPDPNFSHRDHGSVHANRDGSYTSSDGTTHAR